MRSYKNLSKITAVQLAGIKPELEQSIQLGNGKDYVEKIRNIELKLKDEAAYLVICRGDDLFASGMVLVTPLRIEVQEEADSGRVRANVLDIASGGYRAEVQVKAIGSNDHEFRGGDTDLRGIFVADNIHGKTTVIAREGTSRYAFFRGERWLGAPATNVAPAQPAQMETTIDYQGNLNVYNVGMQNDNIRSFQKIRSSRTKGVQVQQAK